MPSFLLVMSVLISADVSKPVDFDHEIIPVLTKAGCNAGSCHGSAAGRGGLRLSLYGGDPAFDYRSIVQELEGRRVNHSRPADSLILLKATESILHGGGDRLEYEGPGAIRLERWIAEGAHRRQQRQLVEFHVSAGSQVIEHVGASVALQASARFDDGTETDVTRWTVFTPEDAAAAEIDDEGSRVTLHRRGRQIVIARYLDRVVPVELIVPLTDAEVDLSTAPRKSFIDEQILQRLSTLRIPPSPQVDDAGFLRRATLDLTGRLPTVSNRQRFLDDPDPNKRARLIDTLLQSEEFTEYWTLNLAKLLRIRSQSPDAQGAWTYHQWLQQQVAEAVPYDEIVRQLLLSIGDTREVGPANFYRTVGGPREQAEFASELLMGSRLRCANCHNHPLDRWTQDDYHGLAAIFAKIDGGTVVKVSTGGEVTHPRTGEPAVPRIPGERFLDGENDGREALADWLTDRSNPYFAKAIVNRLWKAMMGRGLVEPTDDFRDTNPATHPVLLEQLADDFVEQGYDLRHTLRRIALSAAYARSSQPLLENGTDDRFYSHAIAKPLEPEVLADAISDVIGVPDAYGDEPAGTRAVTLFHPGIASESLDVLGRCDREEGCEASTASSGGLPRKLSLLNGELINGRLSDSEGRLEKLIADGKTSGEIVEAFYLRALGRSPSDEERAFWNEQFSTIDDQIDDHSEQEGRSPSHRSPVALRRELLEDTIWSLLNGREFVTNH